MISLTETTRRLHIGKRRLYQMLESEGITPTLKSGHKLIDQNQFYSPTLEKSLDEKLSTKHKSIIIPLGEVKLIKKIKNLSVIFRTNSNIDIWDQNKKRVFEEPKIEYVLRCLLSLTKSINRLKKENSSININLLIIDDNSKSDNLIKIKNVLNENYSKSVSYTHLTLPTSQYV